MRIMLITQWFDPEPTFKGLLFAHELQRQGHEVSVLTGFPNYPGGKLYRGYRIRPFQREVVDGVDVLRVPLFPSHDSSPRNRVLNYASFAASATIGALLLPRPDVAYVYHPPATVGLPAMILKWLKGVPYVYDVQDLWPDTLSATGMVHNTRVLAATSLWMKAVYRSSAEVVVLSDGFRNKLATRGVPPEKLRVIPNWADEAQIKLDRPDARRATELGFAGHFNVVFAGTMGRAQALDTVLDAARILQNVPELQFVMVGGGIDAARLKRRAEQEALANMLFLDRRPVEEIGEILFLADALLVHLADDPLFTITIPSKTQAYLLAGRPILMGVSGDAATMIRDARAGIPFTPCDSAGLAAAICDLMAMTADSREQMGSNGQSYYWQNLALSIGARRFADTFHEAALSRPRLSFTKRLFDLLVAALGLTALALPMAVVALMVKSRLGSPVIFRQSRPGRQGRPFDMVKFRTMNDVRDQSGQLLPDAARITPFGARLRATSLDELPELWNVLRGDMSLVGPRPLLLRYTAYFSEVERLRLLVKPGITGWAQINGRNTSSWDDRLQLDVWYVRNASFRLDLRVIRKTAAAVFTRAGVVLVPESTMQNLDDERRGRVAHDEV